MISLQQIYSLMFFSVFCIAIILGVYILYINPKEKLNRHFYFLSVFLCFWAFGFAISNMAPSMEQALFWRRVSAIGRTTIHVLLLHLVLIITEREAGISKKSRLLLYLPALISLYAYGLSPSIAPEQYNLVHTNIGWVNIAQKNLWSLIFNAYYILYMAINLVLIKRWQRSLQNRDKRRQANILFATFLFTVILGVFTDVVLNALLKAKLPQLGPLLSLVPLLAIFYLTKKNNLMKEKKNIEWEILLSSENRVKLYFLTSGLFLAGSALNALQYFFPGLMHEMNNGIKALPISIGLFFIGLGILLLQFIRNEKVRDSFILFITLLSIPVITLGYVDSASITVWVFPIILMIMSLIFDSKAPITLITIISILTQILVWKYPKNGLERKLIY